MNIPEAISNPRELSLPDWRVRPGDLDIRRPPDVKASEDFPAPTHGGPVTFLLRYLPALLAVWLESEILFDKGTV